MKVAQIGVVLPYSIGVMHVIHPGETQREEWHRAWALEDQNDWEPSQNGVP